MIAFIRLVMKLLMNVLLFPLRVFKIKKNRILLLNNILNFSAKYACSPKYLAEYLLVNYPNKYEIIYPVGKDIDTSELVKKGIVPVVVGTFAYYKYAMTSKVFVTTSGAISYIPFRKKQIIINTWHGGGAYKKAGVDAEQSAWYKFDCKITASRTTCFIASSEKFKEVISSALLIDEKKFLNIGLPRNDIFFSDYSEIIQKVKNFYSIPIDTKIVLYAPTYRTPEASTFLEHQIGPYEIDFEKMLRALTDRFGGVWKFAVRLHPSIASTVGNLPDGVIDMSTYDDIQELMCTADVLINDYSSTMWDFVQTRKPCFIFATDIDKYDNSVGLYTTPSSWPFPLSQTNEQLVDNVLNFDEADYAQQVEKYFSWMVNYENGHACKNICKYIENHI